MTEARMQIKNRLESSGLDRSISGNIFVASAVRKLSRATPRIISRPVIHLAPSNVPYRFFRHFLHPSSPPPFLSADAAFIRAEEKSSTKGICVVRFEIRNSILPRIIIFESRTEERILFEKSNLEKLVKI